MGVCLYCHRKVNWFRNAHDECIKKATSGAERIKKCLAEALIQARPYADVKDELIAIALEGAIPKDQLSAATRDGWSQGAEERSKKEPLSPDEFAAISKFRSDAGLAEEDVHLRTPAYFATIFSFLIWTVLHDKIDPYEGPVSFNIQSNEVPVWALGNVLVKQQSTAVSYAGGHSGVSIRVASGLYYRFGGLQGHRVESTSLQELDCGDFLMTTRGIYFGGRERGVNFKLPFNQVIRFQPYEDAVGICRNGGREQIFVPLGAITPAGAVLSKAADRSLLTIPAGTQIFSFPDSGWFLFNILQALAAKDSAVNRQHA